MLKVILFLFERFNKKQSFKACLYFIILYSLYKNNENLFENCLIFLG